jgi:hypothetical protein
VTIGARLICALIIATAAGCGGSGDTSAVPVSGSVPPTISGSPPTSATAGSAYSFTPTASGPSGSTLSFSIKNSPSWASFSSTNGQLSGTPASGNVGTYANIVISVSDGSASASLSSFTITVAPPPTGGSAALSWTVPTTNTDGSALIDLAGFYVYYGTSATSMSQTVQVGSPTATSYTVTGLAAGTWYFSVSAYTTGGLQSGASSTVSKTIS